MSTIPKLSHIKLAVIKDQLVYRVATVLNAERGERVAVVFVDDSGHEMMVPALEMHTNWLFATGISRVDLALELPSDMVVRESEDITQKE